MGIGSSRWGFFLYDTKGVDPDVGFYGDVGEGIVFLEVRGFGYTASLYDSSVEDGERRWATLQKIKGGQA
eukprot:SAG22_NODE_2217_length_2823_cov_1.554495_1_plen_70_part_00